MDSPRTTHETKPLSTYALEYTQQAVSYFQNTSHNYHSTLKKLLQTPQTQLCVDKTGLSPNGTFKYIDRESSKSINRKYVPYVKPQITSQDRIRRPLNCFMVFSHLERKRVADEHPELHNADLSKILGKRWKNLTDAERQPYIDEAERIRQLHTEIYPEYKYQPRRKGQSKKMQRKTNDSIGLDVANDSSSKKPNDGNTAPSSNNFVSDHYQIKSQELNSAKPNNFSVPAYNNQSNTTLTKRRDNNMNLTNQKAPQIEINKSKTSQYHHGYSRYYSNTTYNELTPDLSPDSCYRENSYNAPPNVHIPSNRGAHMLQSLPPTPEMSPSQMNRDELVFNFDPRSFVGDYVESHLLKTANYSSVDVLYNSGNAKGDIFANHDYYQRNNLSQQNQYGDENFIFAHNYGQNNFHTNMANGQNLDGDFGQMALLARTASFRNLVQSLESIN